MSYDLSGFFRNSSLFYRGLLSTDDQKIYDCVLEGIKHYGQEIVLPKVEVKKLSTIMYFLSLDIPELFIVQDWSVVNRANYTKLLINYCDSPAKCKALFEKMENIVKVAFSDIKKKDYPPVIVAQFVHDYLVENVTYARTAYASSHDITGPLLSHIGVCEGIAKAFHYICARMGVESIVVIGKVNSTRELDVYEKYLGKDASHAWNILRLSADEERYTYVDVTFDLNYENDRRYFGLSSERMLSNRTLMFAEKELPRCESANVIEAYHEYSRKKSNEKLQARIERWKNIRVTLISYLVAFVFFAFYYGEGDNMKSKFFDGCNVIMVEIHNLLDFSE